MVTISHILPFYPTHTPLSASSSQIRFLATRGPGFFFGTPFLLTVHRGPRMSLRRWHRSCLRNREAKVGRAYDSRQAAGKGRTLGQDVTEERRIPIEAEVPARAKQEGWLRRTWQLQRAGLLTIGVRGQTCWQRRMVEAQPGAAAGEQTDEILPRRSADRRLQCRE